jgi:hypothetical protein
LHGDGLSAMKSFLIVAGLDCPSTDFHCIKHRTD